MTKRAKLSATIPNAHGRGTMRHPTTRSSRGESGTTSQGPSFRNGSSELTSRMPTNPTTVTSSIMKAIKLSITSLGRHVTTQAPDTPSFTNNTQRRKKDPNSNPNQNESTSIQPLVPAMRDEEMIRWYEEMRREETPQFFDPLGAVGVPAIEL